MFGEDLPEEISCTAAKMMADYLSTRKEDHLSTQEYVKVSGILCSFVGELLASSDGLTYYRSAEFIMDHNKRLGSPSFDNLWGVKVLT